MINKADRLSKSKKDRPGCIDLGSSYFRLLVADPEGLRGEPGPVRLHENRKYAGWGEFLGEGGCIPGRAIDKASALLAELVDDAAGHGCGSPWIVATNTLRRAANSPAIKSALEGRVSMPVRILSQEGEAAMSLKGVASLYPGSSLLVLADPGGTSTEIAWGRNGVMEGCRGFDIGTHTVRRMMMDLSPRHAGDGPPWRLERIVSRRISDIFTQGADGVGNGRRALSVLPGRAESPKIVFTGGTAASLSILWRFMRRMRAELAGKDELSAGVIALMEKRLGLLAAAGRERCLPLPPERIMLLPAGILIVRSVAGHLEADSFDMAGRDLRWGVILSDGVIPEGYLANE
ncbi:MAG: hypothetical protein MUF59_10280 [Candidatus Krumholzibacteria bacterium]|nr:hypothetical protein [Candidatus Krumholzibacteria bacterium]